MRFKILAAVLLTLLQTLPAHAECFNDAGEYYRIDPDYLRAIAWQESRFSNTATNTTSSGGTTDYCMMQINSSTLSVLKKQYPSLSKRELYKSPCLCIFVGAMLLRRNFNRYGTNWLAVGMYNAGMSNKPSSVKSRYDYAMLIDQHYKDIKAGVIKRPTIKE